MKKTPKTPQPVSIRIPAETRVLLDYVIDRTGLKEAQVIRLAIQRLALAERSLAAAEPKPARTTR